MKGKELNVEVEARRDVMILFLSYFLEDDPMEFEKGINLSYPLSGCSRKLEGPTLENRNSIVRVSYGMILQRDKEGS